MNPQIDVVLAKHHLTVDSVFIPFSQSRNSQEKNPSLNWLVTLKQDGRKIITTDYMAGCAHCPSYKQSFKRDFENERLVMAECEYGGKARWMPTMDFVGVPNSLRGTLKPETRDVIYSLLMDSDVAQYDFDEFCSEFGYDTDSRKAEQTYNACLKIAGQLGKLSGVILDELREVFQDY